MGGGDGVFSVSFYIDGGEGGSDTENTGREQTSPFKTLAAAYRAAKAQSVPVRLVILSDLDVSALEEVAVAIEEVPADESGEGEEKTESEEPLPPPEPFSSIQDAKVITIAGGGTEPVTLTRSGAERDSVLEIGGGAQVTFTNITINGKKGEGEGDKDRRALKIIGDANGPKTKVTLGNGVIITGRITTSSNSAVPSNNDGSGILVSGNAELAMTGDSQVSGCETNTSANHAKGAVVITSGSAFTMGGTSSVSGNTVNSTANASGGVFYGGGVYVSGGTFAMGGSAEVHDNNATGGASSNTTICGGGVYLGAASTLTMGDDAAVSGNTGTNTNPTSGTVSGGGIYANASQIEMNNRAAVNGNKIKGRAKNGGGVYLDSDSTLTMGDNAAVNGNTATPPDGVSTGSSNYGGGIYAKASRIEMNNYAAVTENSIDDSQSSEVNGGGVSLASTSTLTMAGNAVVSSNILTNSNNTSNGSGIYASVSQIEMNNYAAVSKNQINGKSGYGGVTVNNSTLKMAGNAAVNGNTATTTGTASVGGIYITGTNSAVTMENDASVSGNTAATSTTAANGGGIRLVSGTFTMNGGTVSGNKAVSTSTSDTSTGGGLTQSGGSFVMTGGTIYGRPADGDDLLGNTAVSGAAYYKTSTGTGTTDPELTSPIETTITNGVAAEAVVSGQ
jgi:hypothetical protein